MLTLVAQHVDGAGPLQCQQGAPSRGAAAPSTLGIHHPAHALSTTWSPTQEGI